MLEKCIRRGGEDRRGGGWLCKKADVGQLMPLADRAITVKRANIGPALAHSINGALPPLCMSDAKPTEDKKQSKCLWCQNETVEENTHTHTLQCTPVSAYENIIEGLHYLIKRRITETPKSPQRNTVLMQ